MVATGWYRLAASNGYTKSQYALAKAFSNGNVVKKDHVRALRRYTKAAKQVHRKETYELGLIYHNGQGAAANPKELIAYFKEAAPLGYRQDNSAIDAA